MDKVIIDKVNETANGFIKALNLDGNSDVNQMQAHLEGITYRGEPCVVGCCSSFEDFAVTFVDALVTYVKTRVEALEVLDSLDKNTARVYMVKNLWLEIAEVGFPDKCLDIFGLASPASIHKLTEMFVGAVSDEAFKQTAIKYLGIVYTGVKGDTYDAVKGIINKVDILEHTWSYFNLCLANSFSHIISPAKDYINREFITYSFQEAFNNGLVVLVALGPIVIGVGKPMIKTDADDRLHCENGPSVVWGEYREFHWRGIQVPEEWIMDTGNVDIALCFNHENVEQRRSLCEIIGWARVLEKANTKLIQQDKFGELLEVDLPDAESSRFVKVTCGTGRIFALPVPEDMQTAHEAVAWTYGLTPEEYNPEIRT